MLDLEVTNFKLPLDHPYLNGWRQIKILDFGVKLRRRMFNLLIIIGSQGGNLAPGVSGVGSKVWVWSWGSLGVAWYATVRMGWPLKARRSLFPDWPWLCDESSPHRRALHIPVQILAGKFKMEFLPIISLTKAFPVAQIRSNYIKLFPAG